MGGRCHVLRRGLSSCGWWRDVAGTARARTRRYVASVALGFALAGSAAPSALAVDHRPLVEVEDCSAWDPMTPTASCEWQNASHAERVDSLVTAAYIASLGVAMVAGFLVVK